MAETTYTNIISTDFPSGLINPSKLIKEIRVSPIVTALSRVDTADDNVYIVFKDALSVADKTLLDGDIVGPAGGLVAAHDNTPSDPKSIDMVIVEELIPTGGHYQSQSFELAIAAGDLTKELDISFPMPVGILSATIMGNIGYDGDDVSVDVAPDTITGILASDINAGAVIIPVSQTVVDNISVGYSLKLFDGTNTDDLGRVLSINKTDLKVTVETPTINAFLAATPAYIKQTVNYVPHMRLPIASRLVIGESKIGASYLPANKVMKITYKNNQATAKTLSLIIEYLY